MVHAEATGGVPLSGFPKETTNKEATCRLLRFKLRPDPMCRARRGPREAVLSLSLINLVLPNTGPRGFAT